VAATSAAVRIARGFMLRFGAIFPIGFPKVTAYI
jgi:hypothetical protein